MYLRRVGILRRFLFSMTMSVSAAYGQTFFVNNETKFPLAVTASGHCQESSTAIIIVSGGPGATPDYIHAVADNVDASRVCIVQYHPRGVGESRPPKTHYENAEDFSLKLQAQDLVDVVHHIKNNKLADEVGVFCQSYGALVCLQSFQLEPHDFKWVIINGLPALTERSARGASAKYQNLVFKNSRYYTETFPQGVNQKNADLYFRWISTLGRGLTPRDPFNFSDDLLKTSFYLDVNNLASADVKIQQKNDALRKILKDDLPNVPVLFIHGEDDPEKQKDTTEILEALVIPAKYVVLESCGHEGYAQCPKHFFKSIHEFLQRNNIPEFLKTP